MVITLALYGLQCLFASSLYKLFLTYSEYLVKSHSLATYKIYISIYLFHDGAPCYIENSRLMYIANQWTDSIMIRTSVIKEILPTLYSQLQSKKDLKLEYGSCQIVKIAKQRKDHSYILKKIINRGWNIFLKNPH